MPRFRISLKVEKGDKALVDEEIDVTSASIMTAFDLLPEDALDAYEHLRDEVRWADRFSVEIRKLG